MNIKIFDQILLYKYHNLIWWNFFLNFIFQSRCRIPQNLWSLRYPIWIDRCFETIWYFIHFLFLIPFLVVTSVQRWKVFSVRAFQAPWMISRGNNRAYVVLQICISWYGYELRIESFVLEQIKYYRDFYCIRRI